MHLWRKPPPYLLSIRDMDRAQPCAANFFLRTLNLISPADLERQLDGGRRHLFGNQHADGFIDRRPGD
jgi:hypothetical protein